MITYPPNTDLYIENRLGEAAIWWFTEAPWRRGVVVIMTAQRHSSKPELRFCSGSNLACGALDIRDNIL